MTGLHGLRHLVEHVLAAELKNFGILDLGLILTFSSAVFTRKCDQLLSGQDARSHLVAMLIGTSPVMVWPTVATVAVL